MNLLIIPILMSLFCVGWCRLTMKGMLLEKLGVWMDSNLPIWLSKPLGGCVPCSASLIGSVAYLLINNGYNIFEHIFFCIITVGLNMIFWFATENMILLLKIRHKQLEQMNKVSNNCSNPNCKPKPIIKKEISKDFVQL